MGDSPVVHPLLDQQELQHRQKREQREQDDRQRRRIRRVEEAERDLVDVVQEQAGGVVRPPLVRMNRWSTSLNELIVAFTSTNSVVGISSGKVTRRKKYQRDAPSILAASFSSGGSDCSAAR